MTDSLTDKARASFPGALVIEEGVGGVLIHVGPYRVEARSVPAGWEVEVWSLGLHTVHYDLGIALDWARDELARRAREVLACCGRRP